MLITSNNQINNIFEKIIRDKNGVLFRIRFTITNVSGKIQPQIISAEALVENKETVVCLPVIKEKIVSEFEYRPSFVSKISPYFSLDFFMSQPTRAPAL